MRSALRDPSVFDDQDPVRVADRGKTVGDGDDGALSCDAGDSALDLLFRFHIHGSGRLVQNDDRRAAEDRPGDGDALFLTAGEADAALADLRVIAVGHLHDVRVDVCGAGRFADLLRRGVGSVVGDVFRDAAVEQERILQHRRDISAQALQRDAVDVLPVDQDMTGVRLVEAGDQLGEGRLADAGWTYEREHLTRLAVEGNVLQYRDVLIVGETDVIEDQVALHILQIDGAQLVCDLLRRVEDRHDALRAGKGLLHVLEKRREPGHRGIEEVQVQQEGHDVLHAQAVPVGEIAAESNHEHGAEGGDEFHTGVEDGADLQRLKHGADVVEVLFVDASGLVFLPSEGLDLVDAGKVVLQLSVEFAHFGLGYAEEEAHLFRKDDAGDQDQRDRGAGDQRQFRVDGQQHDQHAGKGREVRDGLRDHMGVKQLEVRF